MSHPIKSSETGRPDPYVKPKLPRCISRRISYLDVEIDGLHNSIERLKQRVERANNDKHIHGDEGAADELTRLTAKRVQTTGRLDAMKRLRNDVDAWLSAAANRGIKLQEYDRKFGPKQPKEGSVLREMIDKARGEIAQIKADMFDVRRAPVKIDNLKKQITSYVHALAKEGAPANITVSEGGQVRIEFTSMGSAVSPHKYLAWLDPQRMIDRLVEEIGERQALNGRKAMTAGEKQAELEYMEAALEKLERREIALVDLAIEQEVAGVQHRADVNIPAFLGVETVKALARKAA